MDIDDIEVRRILFSLAMYLNKDFDGDFIKIEDTVYYVDVSHNYISIHVHEKICKTE